MQEEDRTLDVAEVLKTLRAFAGRMRTCYRLFFAALALCFVLLVLLYAFGTPTYTAVAVIGPPNPSPINSMMAAMSGSALGGGAAKKLLGSMGGGGNANDPFEQLKQFLQSPQMSVQLAGDKDFMSKVFYKDWDEAANDWAAPGTFATAIGAVKRALQRPVAEHPDAVKLDKYLDTHFSIEASKGVNDSAVSSLASMASGYLVVSFDAKDPKIAEQLLSKILMKADGIIRDQQRRDVDARMSYIEGELRNITQAEQRDALIQILANQDELKVMLVADKRFSFVMVSEPYASLVPTSPLKPTKAVLVSLVLSLILWALLVGTEEKFRISNRIVRFFRSKRYGG